MLYVLFNIFCQKRLMCHKKMIVVPVVAVVGTVVTVLTVLTVGVVAVVGDSVVNVVGLCVLSTTPHTQARAKYRVIHKSFQIKIQFESNIDLPSFSKNKNQRRFIKKTNVFTFCTFRTFC